MIEGPESTHGNRDVSQQNAQKDPKDKSYTEAIKDFVGDKITHVKESIFYGEKADRDTLTGKALNADDQEPGRIGELSERSYKGQAMYDMRGGDQSGQTQHVDNTTDAINFNKGEDAARQALNKELSKENQQGGGFPGTNEPSNLGGQDENKGKLEEMKDSLNETKDSLKENIKEGAESAAQKIEEFCHKAETLYDEATT